jgi:Reverse transcriptase (RNA-dependent DNA polymerase)
MEALYVDDLLIAGSTKNMVTQLESIFEAKYKMKKLNAIKQLLGMGIFHDKLCNTIYILLNSNILNILLNYLVSMGSANSERLWMNASTTPSLRCLSMVLQKHC